MTPNPEVLSIQHNDDIVKARHLVRARAVETGFSLTNQTKLVTAVSELARNTFVHGGGGTMTIETLSEGTRQGVRIVFSDRGPGIPDIELAMKDGYTTAGGLGLGLGGSKRLVHEFRIVSEPGLGTTVTITHWK